MNKTLVFDMDGTLVNLYSVNDWLSKLRHNDPSPFVEASPLMNMEYLNSLLLKLKERGYKIVITTWTPKRAESGYCQKVKNAKIEWLNKYNFPFDEIHVITYGTTKANCTRKYKGIQTLFDDNAQIRKGWNLGAAIDPDNMIDYLLSLLA